VQDVLENALFIVLTVYIYIYVCIEKNVEEMDFQFEELEMKASLAICNLNKTFSDGST